METKNNGKKYRRYCGTSLSLCRNPQDGKAFDPSLQFLLQGLGFKARVESLKGLIASVIKSDPYGRYGDEYVSRLMPVFARALSDSAYEDILKPVERGGFEEYEYEDIEFLFGFDPFLGTHRSIPVELRSLYASLPVQLDYRYGEPRKVAMPLTKLWIVDALGRYCSQDPQAFDELLVFLLNCSNNKGILKEEMDMWKDRMRNQTKFMQEGILLHHAQRVTEWNVWAPFKEDLLRFLLVARLQKLDLKGLSGTMTPS